MKKYSSIIASVLMAGSLSVIASYANAEQIPVGTYKQTSSTAGDCARCEITILQETPHIIKVTGNNWVGYAYYTQQDDKYRGAFEWKAGVGAGYENVVFLFDLVYEGKTITMNAKSNPLNFSSTYRMIK